MSKQKTSDILLKITASAVDGCLDLAICFLDPYGMRSGRYDKEPRFADLVSERAARAAAERLKTSGYLEKVEKNGAILYKITEKGRNKIKKNIFNKDKWDGKWRVVVFDIPEAQKKIRDMLRRKLKLSGFKQLQRSVWVSPFDNLDEIEGLENEFNLHGCLWFFLSSSIKNEDRIIEMFVDNKN